MSERESDKGSVYKQKLRAKAKSNKDSSKKTQKSDTDKAYETDGPASAAGSTRTLDRAYESDTLGVPNTGYVPPPLGSGADRIPPAEQDAQQNVASTPALTEQELNRMLAAGLFDTDETPQIRDREVSTTKVAMPKEPEADKSAAAEVYTGLPARPADCCRH